MRPEKLYLTDILEAADVYQYFFKAYGNPEDLKCSIAVTLLTTHQLIIFYVLLFCWISQGPP